MKKEIHTFLDEDKSDSSRENSRYANGVKIRVRREVQHK